MPEIIIQDPEKQSIINTIKRQSKKDLSNLMKDIMRDKIEKTKDMLQVNKFFSELYDELYYDIIFKKIKINKKTSRLLESLAMPLDRKSDEEWKEIINKIKKS